MSDFTQVFQDDFNGSSLNRDTWSTLYSGEHWNGMFRWDPSQIEVGDGKLTIATERDGGGWVSGGLSTIPEGETYGSFEVRARVDAGQGTSGVILLWPSHGGWTSEIDILETNRPQRDGFAFTNHGDPNTTEYINDVDVSEWHDYRLEWRPGELKLFVDGQEKTTVTSDVPAEEMSFSLQGQVHGSDEHWFGGAPDGSTPDRVEMEVDWVKVSRFTPGSGTEAPAVASADAPSATSADAPSATSADALAATSADAPADAPGEPAGGWLAAAERYIANDGEWDGSWRNQVADGQISLQDVADRLAAGLGNADLWA